MAIYSANFEGKGKKIAIVVARWNDFITERLLSGAKDTLVRHGVSEENIDICYVPGSFEISLAAMKLAKTDQYDGLICLGAVIRGATPHFDYVAGEAAKGLSMVMLQQKIPLAFGILTTDTIEQAIERAGTKAGNKGAEAATTVLEMANLLTLIE